MNMKEIATLFGVEEKDKSMKNKTKADIGGKGNGTEGRINFLQTGY